MVNVDLENAAENIRILIETELETEHWMEGHAIPARECPVCRAHHRFAYRPGAEPTDGRLWR